MFQKPPIGESNSFSQQYSNYTIDQKIQQQVYQQVSSMLPWITQRIDESLKTSQSTIEDNINQKFQKGINDVYLYINTRFNNLATQTTLFSCQKENSSSETDSLQQNYEDDPNATDIEIEQIKINISSLQEKIKIVSDDYEVLFEKVEENMKEVDKWRWDDKKVNREELKQTQNKISKEIKAMSENFDNLINDFNENIEADEIERNEKFKIFERKIEDSLKEKFSQKKSKWKKNLEQKIKEIQLSSIENTKTRIEEMEKSLKEKFESLALNNERTTIETFKTLEEAQKSIIQSLFQAHCKSTISHVSTPSIKETSLSSEAPIQASKSLLSSTINKEKKIKIFLRDETKLKLEELKENSKKDDTISKAICSQCKEKEGKLDKEENNASLASSPSTFPAKKSSETKEESFKKLEDISLVMEPTKSSNSSQEQGDSPKEYAISDKNFEFSFAENAWFLSNEENNKFWEEKKILFQESSTSESLES